MDPLLEQVEPPPATARSVTGRPLNAMDGAMLSVNEALRAMGDPGFETQVLLWLDGRIDVDRLRNALSALANRYPVVTSRLDRGETDRMAPAAGAPRWRYRPGADCTLHEVHAASADPQDVLRFAAGSLSQPGWAEFRDPVRFSLIHRPDGRDVLLIQYDHTVMDNNAAVLLLRQIETLSGTTGEALVMPKTDEPDLLAEYLGRFPRHRRLRAAAHVLNLRYRGLRNKPATWSGPECKGRTPVRFGLALRRLGVDETEAFRSRAMSVSGFPAESMAVLAGVLRALPEAMPNGRIAHRDLVAGLGVDLGLRGEQGPIFQNLMSIVPMHARPEELSDWANLVRQLNAQLRDRLTREIDLGVLQLAALGAYCRPLMQWALRRLLRSGYSLWHAHFGTADAIGEEFCGAPVEDVTYTASTWRALGVMFIAHRFRGRLHLQMTYVPEQMTAGTAETLLDAVRRDLIPPQGGPRVPSRPRVAEDVAEDAGR